MVGRPVSRGSLQPCVSLYFLLKATELWVSVLPCVCGSWETMKVLEVWIRVSLIWHFDNFFCFFYLSNLLVALVYNFGTWSLVFNGLSTMMQVIQGWLWTEFHEKNFLIYNFFWISFSDLNFWKFSTFLQWRQLHINSRRIVSAIRFLFRFCLAFLSKLRNFSTDHRSTFNFRL